MINLLYQSPWPIGGSTSYTVHLAKVLGNKCRIIRLGKRTENRDRPLGKYGVSYRILSLEDILSIKGKILLTASNPKQDENHWVALGSKRNVWATFHDPNEFGLYPHWKHFSPKRVVCVRATGLDSMPSGHFIPHPYVRSAILPIKRTQLAISIARTSAIKHSDWIFEANRALPKKHHAKLYGEWNRMWYAHTVRKKYPEVELSPSYPREFGAGVALCQRAHFMIDLTVFKNDGGGSQYSFLEAMDGGAIPVMSTDWCSYRGPARYYGHNVKDAGELTRFLKHQAADLSSWEAQREENYQRLQTTHGQYTIARSYLDMLGE